MLTNHYAVITGAASGLGLEMAKLLAGKGYHLYLADINALGLDSASQEIKSTHRVDVLCAHMDLSLPDAAEKLYDDVRQRSLEVEVLISNAGFFFFGEITSADPERAANMIGLHVHTTSMLAIYFGREMKAKGRGYIMMTSSISAYQDFPGIGFYGASKSYIKSFGLSLRHELRYYGVNVSVLCPGATLTNLYDPKVIDVEKGKRWGIMMDADKVAKAGVEGMFKGKSVIMPGLLTKIMTYTSALLPGWLIFWVRVKWRRLL
jgi:short-subunit dehydrogenase